MRVGFDIDGCGRDIHAKLIQVYKREMKIPHWCDPPEKWFEYEISKHFDIGKGIYDFWFHTHAEEIYKYSLAYPDIFEIRNLSELGHDIIVLTDQPNPATERYTLWWIQEHIPYDEIHFTPDKGKVPCDIYLDDAPYHIENIKSHGGEVVIRNHRWNQDVHSIHRVDNLSEFATIVREII